MSNIDGTVIHCLSAWYYIVSPGSLTYKTIHEHVGITPILRDVNNSESTFFCQINVIDFWDSWYIYMIRKAKLACWSHGWVVRDISISFYFCLNCLLSYCSLISITFAGYILVSFVGKCLVMFLSIRIQGMFVQGRILEARINKNTRLNVCTDIPHTECVHN